MRFLLLAGIILGYGHRSQAQALSHPCVAKTLPNSVKKVTLPGKTLYVFFTPHLSGQINKLSAILSGRSISSKENRDALSQDLRGFLNSHLETVEREMLDVSVIVDMLKSYPDIQWIGIEASRKELESINWVENQLTSYHALKEILLTKGILNLEETKYLLQLVFSEEIIILAEHPELFRAKRFFIPLDDDTYKAKNLGVLRLRRRVWDELVPSRFQALHSLWEKQMKDCKDEECRKPIRRKKERTLHYLELVPAGDTAAIISQEQITAILSGVEDRELHDLVETYFVYHNQFIEYRDQRSREAALVALQQSGNGLITMGSNHEQVVIENLLESCSN